MNTKTMKMNNSAIILLSGGLDSVVSLAVLKHKLDIELAITFNYGQKSALREIESSKKIAQYYNIKHEIINLDWLKKISTSSLTTNDNIPALTSDMLDNKSVTQESAKSVWVPNRNALFINIAACYAESMNISNIIIGANKEESNTFKDNSIDFISAINTSLENSTNNMPKVVAPLIDMNKEEIVKFAVEYKIPFEYIFSCYLNGQKQCGKCESCLRLKRALELNHACDIISNIFE